MSNNLFAVSVTVNTMAFAKELSGVANSTENLYKFMGYIRNHAIIVTGRSSDDHYQKAFRLAESIFGPLSNTTIGVNNTQSFLIPPDGSKEGWSVSDIGDDRRNEFYAALVDLNLCVDAIELYFGGDDNIPCITRTYKSS